LAADDRSTVIDADLEQIRSLASFVRDRAIAAGLSDEALADLELAVVEAANNIVLHGYAGDRGSIRATAGLTENEFMVELSDDAIALPDPVFGDDPLPALTAESGRGLAIIAACVDRVAYRREGGRNYLTLFKAR
jgi:serine/threonine-protein kinase RsbW